MDKNNNRFFLSSNFRSTSIHVENAVALSKKKYTTDNLFYISSRMFCVKILLQLTIYFNNLLHKVSILSNTLPRNFTVLDQRLGSFRTMQTLVNKGDDVGLLKQKNRYIFPSLLRFTSIGYHIISWCIRIAKLSSSTISEQ